MLPLLLLSLSFSLLELLLERGTGGKGRPATDKLFSGRTLVDDVEETSSVAAAALAVTLPKEEGQFSSSSSSSRLVRFLDFFFFSFLAMVVGGGVAGCTSVYNASICLPVGGEPIQAQKDRGSMNGRRFRDVVLLFDRRTDLYQYTHPGG